MPVIFFLLFFSACSACPSQEDEPARVSSKELLLKQVIRDDKSFGPDAKRPVRVINIGPSKESSQERTGGAGLGGLPSEVSMNNSLTSRLRDKLREAFSERGTSPPDIEIYTGVMDLNAFSKHYEDMGYKVQRTSVPASHVIGPLLDERPELADRISLSNYAGITINQVIVEGANISAADKYIDPETYEVVYKTFVTVTKAR